MSLQRQQPILTTATQTPTKATITCQSKRSLVALQHVRFAQDKGLNARGITSKGCHEQGRPAVPAHAHISAPPNTQPFIMTKTQHPVPSKTTTNPNHINTNTHNSNHNESLKTLTRCTAARPLCKQSAQGHNRCVRLMLLQVVQRSCHTNQSAEPAL